MLRPQFIPRFKLGDLGGEVILSIFSLVHNIVFYEFKLDSLCTLGSADHPATSLELVTEGTCRPLLPGVSREPWVPGGRI